VILSGLRFSIAMLLLLVLIQSSAAYSGLPGVRQSGTFDTNPPTPYYHYTNRIQPRSRLLVVHGLGGNKDMLSPLCYGLADAGIEVFSIDLPGHGSSTEHFNAVEASDVVRQILTRLGPDTNVLGHSFGGALLLDITSSLPVKSMVLFSPAPTKVDQVLADRVLLFQGQLDLAEVRRFTPDLNMTLEGRVDFYDLPWTDHTGGLVDPHVIQQVADWLGGDPLQVHPMMRSILPTIMLLSSLGFGILLLGLGKPSPAAAESAVEPISFNNMIVLYIGAALLGAVLPNFIDVTRWLHLFAADYLVAVIFIAGLVLCFACPRVRVAPGPLLIGIAAAAYAIAVPGLMVLSKFTQMWLAAPRFLRFGAMTVLTLPFFFADEMLVRPIRPRWKGIIVMLLTRALLAAIIVTAVLEWKHDSGFLYFMMDSIFYFWIGLWFTGWLIDHRTNDALATAAFMAIVQGWVFAALFVTT
jgi:pimeloyl-ACP methyl ester carboxylesterase